MVSGNSPGRFWQKDGTKVTGEVEIKLNTIKLHSTLLYSTLLYYTSSLKNERCSSTTDPPCALSLLASVVIVVGKGNYHFDHPQDLFILVLFLSVSFLSPGIFNIYVP